MVKFCHRLVFCACQLSPGADKLWIVISSGRGLLYDGNCRHDFVNDMLGEHAIVDNVEDNEMDRIEFFLANRTPLSY